MSPLLKFRSVVKYDSETCKFYQLCIVVRLNGCFEVYSNFMLVSNHYDKNYQCVDVMTDFNQFYLKFVKNSSEISQQSKLWELDFEIRQLQHFWRNRISFNTSVVKKDQTRWDCILHYRIAQYCKLYTQILNYSLYMLVSHRNMISVFDMTKTQGRQAKWIDTIKFNEGHIRQMFIKKNSKVERSILAKMATVRGSNKHKISIFQQSRVICFVGINSIH